MNSKTQPKTPRTRTLGIAKLLPLLPLLGALSHAQQPGIPTTGPGNEAGKLYASNFGLWSVSQGNQGQYSWATPSLCAVSASGITLRPVFAVGTPITIKDQVPANTEVVTPTAVRYSNSGCSITINPQNPHSSFVLTSATAGLQEAINYTAGLQYQIVLTPDWVRLGGTTQMITSAQGNANVSILDERTAVLSAYVWSNGAYVNVPFGGGGSPGGPPPAVQVNVNGAFAGYNTLTYDLTDGLCVGGCPTGPKVHIGPLGTITSDWYFDDTSPGTACSSIAPFVCADAYLNVADGHLGADMCYAINAAIQASPVGSPLAIYVPDGKWSCWTQIVLNRQFYLTGPGAWLIPQVGGANGVWGGSLAQATCSVALGTGFTCANPAGLTTNMAVGTSGSNLFADAYISAISGTTVTTNPPPSLIINGYISAGSNQLCGVNSLNNLQTGQGIHDNASNTYIPPGTTITVPTTDAGSVQCITLSNNATQSTPWTNQQDIAFTITGAVSSVTLSAEAVAPVILVEWNPSEPVNSEGLNYGSAIEHLKIVDPGYFTAATPITGVQALQSQGQDSFLLNDFDVRGIGGSARIQSGNCPSCQQQQPEREGEDEAYKYYDDGDFLTGQSALVNITGNDGSGDENNTNHYVAGNIVDSRGPDLHIATYNAAHTANNGPRINDFHGLQAEGGSHYGQNLCSPFDRIIVSGGDGQDFFKAFVACPGYGKSGYRVDNGFVYNTFGGGNQPVAKLVTLTVTASTTSKVVTFTNPGWSAAQLAGALDGVGVILGGVNNWTQTSNAGGAINGAGTQITLRNYPASSGSLTMTIGYSGFAFDNTRISNGVKRQAPGVEFVQQDTGTASLLGIPSLLGLEAGYQPIGGHDSYVRENIYGAMDIDGGVGGSNLNLVNEALVCKATPFGSNTCSVTPSGGATFGTLTATGAAAFNAGALIGTQLTVNSTTASASAAVIQQITGASNFNFDDFRTTLSGTTQDWYCGNYGEFNWSCYIATSAVKPFTISTAAPAGALMIGATGTSVVGNLGVGTFLNLYSGAAATQTTPSVRGNTSGTMVVNAFSTARLYLNRDSGTGGFEQDNGGTTTLNFWDNFGTLHRETTAAPTANAGTIATGSTNESGGITGLSAATSVTLTFSTSGAFTTNVSCVANSSVVGVPVAVTSLSTTSATFGFASLTGSLYYHCGGN